MARDEELKERWDNVVKVLSDQFADGDPLDLDSIIYLIRAIRQKIQKRR